MGPHRDGDAARRHAGQVTGNLDDCGPGTVEDGSFRLDGSRNSGIFNGFKLFTSDGGEQLVIRLQARVRDGGSTGTWAFVGGTYAGNGRLVGVPFEVGEGITDVYDGTVHP